MIAKNLNRRVKRFSEIKKSVVTVVEPPLVRREEGLRPPKSYGGPHTCGFCARAYTLLHTLFVPVFGRNEVDLVDDIN